VRNLTFLQALKYETQAILYLAKPICLKLNIPNRKLPPLFTIAEPLVLNIEIE
jgi:hypothetical protein